ncbi:unnamed protein product, partial [Arctogadus glacialis]
RGGREGSAEACNKAVGESQGKCFVFLSFVDDHACPRASSAVYFFTRFTLPALVWPGRKHPWVGRKGRVCVSVSACVCVFVCTLCCDCCPLSPKTKTVGERNRERKK